MNRSVTKTYAVISDVHGNYKALEAFLEYCNTHPVNGIIGLGDYVTDSPYPERTIALLKQMREKYRCYMVRGNRENYLLDNLRKDQGWKPSSSSGCFYYTARHLSQEDMEFLESMPEEMQVAIEGCPELYICHGTPGNMRGNVDYNPELEEEHDDTWPKGLRPYPYGKIESQGIYNTDFSGSTKEEMQSYIEDLKKDGFSFRDFIGIGLSEADSLNMGMWLGTKGELYVVLAYENNMVSINYTTENPGYFQ